jgi:psiF repeat
MQQITPGALLFSRISGAPSSARDNRKDEFMKLTHSAVAIALVTFLAASGSAFAETAATPAPAAKSTAMSPEKSAISKSCSQQADAKGLHGKARKHFRSECKHNGGKGE